MIKQILSSKICLKCQGCCRFAHSDSVWTPALLNEDIQELLENNIPPALISSNKKIRPVPDAGKDNFVCAFLNTSDNQCKIYSFRPFECQLYPFMLNRKEKKVFLAVDLRCPFVKENKETIKFKRYTRYLVDFLNSSAQLNILKDNPGVFQEYGEVFDISELKI